MLLFFVFVFIFSSSYSLVCVHLVFLSIPFCSIFFLSRFIFLLWFLVLVLCLCSSLHLLCVQHQILSWILSFAFFFLKKGEKFCTKKEQKIKRNMIALIFILTHCLIVMIILWKDFKNFLKRRKAKHQMNINLSFQRHLTLQWKGIILSKWSKRSIILLKYL